MSCWVTPTGAQEKDARAAAQAEQVTITGARLPSDEELTKQVATALRSDPYVDDSHLTVSVSNGVVRTWLMVFGWGWQGTTCGCGWPGR